MVHSSSLEGSSKQMQHVGGGSSFFICSAALLLPGLGIMVGFFLEAALGLVAGFEASVLTLTDLAVPSSLYGPPPPIPWVASAVEMRSSPLTAA